MTGRKLVGLTIWLLGVLGLVGCEGGEAAFNAAAPNARATIQVFNLVYVIVAIVWIIVYVTLYYALIKGLRNKKEGIPKQTESNLPLEMTWTIIPAILLGVITVQSLGVLGKVTSPPAEAPAGGTPLHVRIIGHQWFWEFQYPDSKIVTANELVLPVGVQVNADVESVDVIHSYWIPNLGGKIDAIPGTTNQIYILVEKPGTYTGQCAEFCGADHAQMRMTVVAKNAADFDAWVKGQQAPPPQLSAEASQGQDIFLAEPCIGCHTIAGTKAQGNVGPNLTHFASRSIFAGGTLPNNPENLSKWLADPQAIKPGNLMPNLYLGGDTINLLVTYLESLK